MAEQGHFWFCRVGGRVGCGWEPSWELYALGLATIQTRFYLTVKQFTVHQRQRTAARGWATHLKARCALKPSLCPRPHCDPGKRKRPVSKILLFVFLNCQLRYRFCLYDSHSPRGLGMSRELALELGGGDQPWAREALSHLVTATVTEGQGQVSRKDSNSNNFFSFIKIKAFP